ncbi:MAG: diphthamide biosynthesis enzyme Dph2 [Candidatus Aenigmarchaeota archaeon]|nr:diphthamide biosynthesis enzyme Dph2 [Candidatus Aenigmarchaeota archaeon]
MKSIIEKLTEDMKVKITERKARKILLQVPEGLKIYASEIAGNLEMTGPEVIISIEPCFGACDLRDNEAKKMGCDLLVHIGHADFGVRTEVPVIHHEFRMEYDFRKILIENIKKLEKFKKIGVMTTIQYVDSVPQIKQTLEHNGKEVLVGNNKKTGYQGHVLGCDFSAVNSLENKVDCFIYFGSGRFHPSGFLTEKPFFVIDSERGEIFDISPEIRKEMIKKELSIEKARNMKNFVIYISTKPGQMHPERVHKIKKKLLSIGKEVIVVSADMLIPEKLLGIKCDVVVNTACPRLKEDSLQFKKIILNPEDVDKL